MNIKRSSLNAQNVAFSGHAKKIDKQGNDIHSLYYLYDPKKWNCEVELYNVVKDKKGNLSLGSLAKRIPMPNAHVEVRPDDMPEITSSKLGFAYRFKLTDKQNPKNESYAFDNGTVIGIFNNKEKNNKFNVVLSNSATINKNGPMQLIMPDEYFPGVVNRNGQAYLDQALRAVALTSKRTHANKLGGNLQGIIARLDSIKKSEGVKRIVGTPFTEDNISSHMYWTENAYRVSPSLGTEEDFKTLQVELFKRGINWIADAALVNEGFCGIHMSEFLRKGQDSISKDMFRADEKVSLGIIPDETKYTKIKMINAPFTLTENGEYAAKNDAYNPKKPTYVQFYDTRLATEEQIKSDRPLDMTTYANKNTDNMYDITKHDDAVYPFPIEVDPAQLKRNVQTLYKETGKVDLGDVSTIKAVLDFQNFNVENKSAAAGLEVWDGNVDIAKLNFFMSLKDDLRFAHLPESERKDAVADFKRGALAVRDYAINSGKHWTKLASDTQLKYTADFFGAKQRTPQEYLTLINKAIKNGDLPESVYEIDIDVLTDVLDGEYKSRLLDVADMRSPINTNGFANVYTYEDYLLKQSMDLPLETLPVATNLLGVLTSPYIAKKANVEEELGVSRYDLASMGNPNLPKKYSSVYEKMDDIYKSDLMPILKKVFSEVDGLSNSKGNVTPLGKFAVSELAPDLTKYLLLKALCPEADVQIKNGEFDFSKVDESEITIQSLGIPFDGMTMEKEAATVVKAIKNGLNELPPTEINKLIDAVNQRMKNRSLDGYLVSEMILDRTESGLGWRIDAAKDIASIDSVRSNVDSMTDAWNNVISFWKKYNETVLVENPHAYTTAEITDLHDLFAAEMPFAYEANPLAYIDEKRFTPSELKLIEQIKRAGLKEENLSTQEMKDVYAKAKQIHAERIKETLEHAVYTSEGDAERKFLEETGITSIANYNFFFSLLPEMYALNKIEDGDTCWPAKNEQTGQLREKLHIGWDANGAFGVPNIPGFLYQSPDIGVTNSYTFFGNHDKPRALHCLALDMALFNSNFTSEQHKQIAKDVLNNQSITRFTDISPMAIAMGERLNRAFDSVLQDEELKAAKEAVSQLASGEFKGSKFDPTAFGTRPFEIALDSVFEQVEANGKSIANVEVVKAKMLKNILEPAMDRYLSMYKTLITLPGSPTDFAGDRVGSTGYETKAKNYHQQNRNIINWEWLDKPEYEFVRKFYEQANSIAALRQTPELSALNDGATVTLLVNNNLWDDVNGTLRYNDEGSVVLSLYSTKGANTPYYEKLQRGKDGENVISDKDNKFVFFDGGEDAKIGVKHGLAAGTVFYNASEADKDEKTEKYVVGIDEKTGKYYLQKFVKSSVSTGSAVVQVWDKKPQPISIDADDLNTLVLYKADK